MGSAGIWTRDLLHPKQESYPYTTSCKKVFKKRGAAGKIFGPSYFEPALAIFVSRIREVSKSWRKSMGSAGIWTRDLLHPKQESYP